MSKDITIQLEINKETTKWVFKRMSLEDSAELAPVLKARFTMMESLQKRMELMDKLPDEEKDMDAYFALSDQSGKCMKEVIRAAKKLAEYVTSHDQAFVTEAMETNIAAVLPALVEYMGEMFPNEEDEKKS